MAGFNLFALIVGYIFIFFISLIILIFFWGLFIGFLRSKYENINEDT